ncbi:hypothetical protein I6G66_06140 [Delftia acidovorans]|uniref:Uncharacterized protein n=1 Tax=Delftia acidovorans TaxID=80866 RepID=A0A7T2S617_DELAC|nr:hypothetical protein [Delftia acidovorans]QPS09600.1 hypothetical protein I6G66_06140 [Delftia acidovorans]
MATTSEKICISCDESWPADVGFFRPLVKSPDGLADQCNACVCDKYRRYRIRNPSRPRATDMLASIWMRPAAPASTA